MFRSEITFLTRASRAVDWPKYAGEEGAVSPDQVPVLGVNSGVNVGDPGPSVCPYPIEMCM